MDARNGADFGSRVRLELPARETEQAPPALNIRWREIAVIYAASIVIGLSLMAAQHDLPENYQSDLMLGLFLLAAVWAAVSIGNVGWTAVPARGRKARRAAACWIAGMLIAVPVSFLAAHGLMHRLF